MASIVKIGVETKRCVNMEPLIDPDWYKEELTAREKKMLMRLEEAEKILKKPDYEIVEKLRAVDIKSPDAQKQIEDIIAEAKSRPMSERKTRKAALWIVPYSNGKAKRSEKRRITEDLGRAQEIEKHLSKGTEPVRVTYHRTLFPDGIMDRGKNCRWLFRPSKMEVVKD